MLKEIESIKTFWKEKEEQMFTYTANMLVQKGIQEHTATFFIKCGFPLQAGPFDFSDIRDGKLQNLASMFQYEQSGLDKYLVFGSNLYGDPLCIDLSMDEEIVSLNHDNNLERIYINSGILEFASCIVAYEKSCSKNAKFSDGEFEELRKKFLEFDPGCIMEESFWAGHIGYLLFERDNE
jgi:hypothetical protein